MRRTQLFAYLFLALAACGGDDGPASPTIVPGGGARDPGVSGTLHVYTIDGATDQPIAGATVQVGTLTGTTDAAGLFSAKGDLSGPQMVAAKATGYATAVWVGVDSQNITMSLDKSPEPTTTPPHAEIAGTIAGWDSVRAPAAGHFVGALVTYTQSRDLGADDNNLEPPPSGTQLASNVCIKVPPPAPSPACAWRINARVGTVVAYATFVDVDQQGTPTDDSDDTFTITGYATSPNLTVVAGATQSGVMLTQLAAGSTTTVQPNLGTPPTGLASSLSIVGVDLGAAGVLRVPPVPAQGSGLVLPSLSALPGSSYELLALARETVADGTAAESIVVRRGITSASAIAAGDWMAPPTGLSTDRTMASYAAVTGAGAHTMDFDSTQGSGPSHRVMSVLILDGTAAVTLPVAFSPLPTGGLLYKVSAIDAGAMFDPQDFAIDDLSDTLARLSSETIRIQ